MPDARFGRVVMVVVLLVVGSSRLLPGQSRPENSDRDALKARLIERADGYLQARAATVSALTTRGQAEARQAALRAKVLRLIGGLPTAAERGPLNAKTVGSWQGEGFHVERVLYDSLPGFHVTADLYLPDGGKGPFPAVVDTPGHTPSGKLGEFAFAAGMARNGIAVLAIDPLGQGERLQYLDPATGASAVGHPTGEHGMAGVQPALVGDHLSRYFVNDGIRGIDYLETRPEIAAKRIGAFGCSGGGADTAYLAALEGRVKAVAVACYVTTYHDLYHSATGIQEAEQTIPGFIAEDGAGPAMDIPDWVEMAAPRPYAVISTTEDMFPFTGATKAVAEARAFYALFGPAAQDRLQWITGPGRHGNLRPLQARIVGFFLKNLAGSDAVPVEGVVKAPAEKELLVTSTGQVGSSLGGETVASLNRRRAAGIRRPKLGRAGLQGAIREVNGIAAGPKVAGGTGGGVTRLVLTDDVTAAAAAGTVLVGMRPVPVGTEELKAKALGPLYLLSLQAMVVGETLPGIRTADVLGAIDKACPCTRLEVEAPAKYGLVAMQAAVLDGRVGRVTIHGRPVSFAELVAEPVTVDASEQVIPGVLRRYDLPELERALGRRLTILPE